MAKPHTVLVHPELTFSSGTERLFASLAALREQEVRLTLVSRGGSRAVVTRESGAELRYQELPIEPHRAILAALRTRRELKRLEPDVLHYTHQNLAALATFTAARVPVPYVIELHGPVLHRIPHDPELLACAIVPSEALRESAINHGQVPRDKVRIVPHAPAPVEHSGPAPFSGPRPPLIGCACALDDNHDVEWFLDAARLLTLEGVRAHFVVLGEGPRDTRLRRRVRKGGMSEHITIAVPTTLEVGRTLADLDANVSCRLPGPGWLAATGLVQGVPSILSAVGEAFQLVEDRVSGVLVEPGDAQRLADEIRTLIHNPAAARAMGSAGRELALERNPPRKFALAVAEVNALALGSDVAEAI